MESSYEKLKIEEHRPPGGCRFDLLAFCLLPVCLLPFCLFPFRLHLLFNTSSIMLSLYSLFDSRILSDFLLVPSSCPPLLLQLLGQGSFWWMIVIIVLSYNLIISISCCSSLTWAINASPISLATSPSPLYSVLETIVMWRSCSSFGIIWNFSHVDDDYFEWVPLLWYSDLSS